MNPIRRYETIITDSLDHRDPVSIKVGWVAKISMLLFVVPTLIYSMPGITPDKLGIVGGIIGAASSLSFFVFLISVSFIFLRKRHLNTQGDESFKRYKTFWPLLAIFLAGSLLFNILISTVLVWHVLTVH